MADPVLVDVMRRLTADIIIDAENLVYRAWRDLPDLTDDAARTAVAQVVPAVDGAQRLVASLHTQYLNQVTQLALAVPEVALLIPEARWNWSPMIQARRLVSEGTERPAALELASRRAAQVHSGDVLRARDDAMTAYSAGAETLRPVRWAKTPFSDACSWCRQVSTQLYTRPDGLPVHLNDRCGLNAVTPADDLSSFTNAPTVFANTRWRSQVSSVEMRQAQVRVGAQAERLATQAMNRMRSQEAA